jgi:hypothetical protein
LISGCWWGDGGLLFNSWIRIKTEGAYIGANYFAAPSAPSLQAVYPQRQCVGNPVNLVDPSTGMDTLVVQPGGLINGCEACVFLLTGSSGVVLMGNRYEEQGGRLEVEKTLLNLKDCPYQGMMVSADSPVTIHTRAITVESPVSGLAILGSDAWNPQESGPSDEPTKHLADAANSEIVVLATAGLASFRKGL